MTDYDQCNMPPWYDFKGEITSLSLPDGLTSIGDLAFYDCSEIKSVSIPKSVTDIGQLAFCQCSGIAILTLNEGISSIGRSAFELCSSLPDLRLPGTLKIIGYHAFYRCEALRYATVPASVTFMDSGAFAYCSSLVRADIKAPLSALPAWTFYDCTSLASVYLSAETTQVERFAFHGCEKLGTVYYGGNAGDSAKLKAQISEDISGFHTFGEVTDEVAEGSGYSYTTETTEDGDVVIDNVDVAQTGEATITITTTIISGSEENPNTDIVATVITPDGWIEVLEIIESAIEISGDNRVTVTVYTTEGTDVPQSFIDALTGKNVVMTVHSSSGSRYVIDFTRLSDSEMENKLDMSYSVVRLVSTEYVQLDGADVYQIVFNNSSTVNAEVMIQLPVQTARNTAVLYQVKKGNLEVLQSVVVDEQGLAHYYLASIDKDMKYLIGINVRSAEGEPIIPTTLHSEYGITESAQIEYVITGRTSSWHMSFGQVIWIMAGGMVGCAIIIGIVMFSLNKRKLIRGDFDSLKEE